MAPSCALLLVLYTWSPIRSSTRSFVPSRVDELLAVAQLQVAAVGHGRAGADVGNELRQPLNQHRRGRQRAQFLVGREHDRLEGSDERGADIRGDCRHASEDLIALGDRAFVELSDPPIERGLVTQIDSFANRRRPHALPERPLALVAHRSEEPSGHPLDVFRERRERRFAVGSAAPEKAQQRREPGRNLADLLLVEEYLRGVDLEEDRLDIFRRPPLEVTVEVAPLQVEHLFGDATELSTTGELELGDDLIPRRFEGLLIVRTEYRAHRA